MYIVYLDWQVFDYDSPNLYFALVLLGLTSISLRLSQPLFCPRPDKYLTMTLSQPLFCPRPAWTDKYLTTTLPTFILPSSWQVFDYDSPNLYFALVLLGLTSIWLRLSQPLFCPRPAWTDKYLTTTLPTFILPSACLDWQVFDYDSPNLYFALVLTSI